MLSENASPSRDAALLAGIVLGGLLLRLTFFAGFVASDDTFYVDAARRFVAGEADPITTHWGARIGLVLPTAAAFSAFGAGEWQAVLFPLIASCFAPWIAFLLGRELGGRQAGLIAALLAAVMPLDAIFATRLFPTSPSIVLTALALWLFLRGERATGPGWTLGAGLALGGALLVHEVTILCLLFYPVYVLGPGRLRARHALCLLGVIALLGVDALAELAISGDPLHRWSVVAGTGSVRGRAADVAHAGINLRWLLEPFVRAATEQEMGLLPYVAAPIVLRQLVRPVSPRHRAVALWVVVIFLYQSFGTFSPVRYAPLPRLPRYLAPIVLPALALIGAALARWQRSSGRVLVLGVLVLSSVACVWIDGGRFRLSALREAHAWLGQRAPERVVVGKELVFQLRLLNGFSPPYDIEALGDRRPEAVPGLPTVLLVRDAHAGGPDDVQASAAPVAVFDPPESPYGRLLASPRVRRMLTVVRDPYRARALLAQRRRRLLAYELP